MNFFPSPLELEQLEIGSLENEIKIIEEGKSEFANNIKEKLKVYHNFPFGTIIDQMELTTDGKFIYGYKDLDNDKKATIKLLKKSGWKVDIEYKNAKPIEGIIDAYLQNKQLIYVYMNISK